METFFILVVKVSKGFLKLVFDLILAFTILLNLLISLLQISASVYLSLI